MNKRFLASLKKAAVHIMVALLLLQILPMLLSGCSEKGSDFVLPTRTLPTDAEKQSYSYFRYKIYDDDSIILTQYTGESESVEIPDSIEGRPVVALAPELFYQNEKLKSVKFGKNLEEIGTKCFGGCSYLETVIWNDKIWSVGAYAFSGTPWYDAQADEFVIVGDGVLLKYNGDSDGVVIPDTVRHIADVFTMRGVITVTMSSSVRTIGEYAFGFCPLLRNVELSDTLLMIDEYAFTGCESLPSMIIPNTVERIESSAFYECLGLNTVRLSDALTYLGENAFYNCAQIRTIYLPTSLTRLPVGAFEACGSLELVLYAGTEKDFKALVADTSNYLLLDAMIVYGAKRGN